MTDLTDQQRDWTSQFVGQEVAAKGGTAKGGGPEPAPGGGAVPSASDDAGGPPGGTPSTGPGGSPAPGGGAGVQMAAVMDEAWIVSFLTHHRFGPPTDANAPEGACVFDRAASTVTAVVQALDAEAQTEGLPLNANRANIVDDVLSQRRRGASMGASIANHMAAGDDISLFVAGLQRQKMVSMLEALEAVRGAHQLDTLLEMARQHLHDPRVEVAILSVQHHLGGEWQQLMDGLADDADRAAITSHVFGRIEDGDTGEVRPLTHGGTGYQNDTPDDNAWISGFLDFVHAGPDPLGDGRGSTCSFDGVSMPFQRAVDTVVEQAGLSGRMIDQSAVSGVLSRRVVAPPRRQPGQSPAPQFSVAYAFQPPSPQTGSPSTAPAQHQVSYTGTIALHADGQAGLELAWTVQVAESAGRFVLQSIVQGPQAQWVWPFLDGTLQIQVIVSALRGMANTASPASGAVTMMPTTQLSGAGQVTYAIPGTGKHVLIGFQLAAQATMTDGQSPAGALVPQGILQVQW